MEKGNEACLTDIRKYEDILANDPHSFCFAPLSDLYRRMGRLDDALDTALRGCETHPEYIGGYMALGRACFEKRLYNESRQALEKVIGAMPDNILARRLLEEIDTELAKAGECASTEGFETEWGAVNPEEISAGTGVAADGEEDILELTEEIVEADEELPRQQYDYDEEPEAFAPGTAESPANPLNTATIADLYLSQGFTGKALGIYRELLVGDPENDQLRQQVEKISRLFDEEKQCDAEDIPVAALPVDSGMAAEAAQGRTPAPEQSVLETLEGWLANIRRLR